MNSSEHFWSLFERIPFSTCWIWIGGSGNHGYGRYVLNRKRYAAHRLAYELSTGKDAGDLFVCHHCDVPSCINPEHLFLGTQADNLFDMRNKGRDVKPPIKRGEEHYEGKLKNSDILKIRQQLKSGFTLEFIAKMYGVSYGMIGHIKHGRKWSHV